MIYLIPLGVVRVQSSYCIVPNIITSNENDSICTTFLRETQNIIYYTEYYNMSKSGAGGEYEDSFIYYIR